MSMLTLVVCSTVMSASSKLVFTAAAYFCLISSTLSPAVASSGIVQLLVILKDIGGEGGGGGGGGGGERGGALGGGDGGGDGGGANGEHRHSAPRSTGYVPASGSIPPCHT